MKPKITWVIIGNARKIRVLAHQGPGNGLIAVADQQWHAPKITESKDRAGVVHSSAGPGIAAVQQTNSKLVHDTRFAKEAVSHLSAAYLSRKFDRLIVVAGPHMLGLIRENLDAPLRAVLIGEIPKDLSAQSLTDIETHLGELMAV